jgi:creatinine amidohydrolase
MELISVLLEDNPRRVVRRALAAGWLRAAIVPVGSTEQHNEHLAMGHDSNTVRWLARRAAEDVFPAAVVCPVIPLGVSEHWMDHPGTLTLSPETFLHVVYEICDSLRRHGIARIMILNGHGGNRRPLEENIEEFRSRLGVRLDCCSYWDAYPEQTRRELLSTGECPGHAGEFETSVALAAFPDTVHWSDEPYPQQELRIAQASRAADDRRFFVGARAASADKGQRLLDIAARWLADRMRRLLQD